MTEKKKDAPASLAAIANDVGANILKALVGELRSAMFNKGFKYLDETEQDRCIRRLEETLRREIRAGYQVMAGGGFPSIVASLNKVAFTPKDVVGAVSLPLQSEHRHAFADHTGRGVLVVLASPDEYLKHMDQVRGEEDQPDLFKSAESTAPEGGLDGERHHDDDGDDARPTLAAPAPQSAREFDPEHDSHPGPLTRETVLATLELVGESFVAELVGFTLPTLAGIDAWDQETRKAVVDWAGACVASIESADVHVPPMPSVLVPRAEDLP